MALFFLQGHEPPSEVCAVPHKKLEVGSYCCCPSKAQKQVCGQPNQPDQESVHLVQEVDAKSAKFLIDRVGLSVLIELWWSLLFWRI